MEGTATTTPVVTRDVDLDRIWAERVAHDWTVPGPPLNFDTLRREEEASERRRALARQRELDEARADRERGPRAAGRRGLRRRTRPGKGFTSQAPEVEAFGEIMGRRRQADALLVAAALDLVEAHLRQLLTDQGYADPGAMATDEDRDTLRATAKSLAAREIALRSGMRTQESRDLVAVATAPADLQEPAMEAMLQGLASWELVRSFWRATSDLLLEEAVRISRVLFGDDPETVAVERLDPDGRLSREPWISAEFGRALDREVVRSRAADELDEAERRRRARQSRGVSVVAHRDGSATLEIRSDLIAVDGACQRLDRGARLVRRAGDERSLSQLRADIATSLLNHGRLPVVEGVPADVALTTDPETGGVTLPTDEQGRVVDLPDTTVADLAGLADIVNGMPAVTVGVVAPLGGLVGTSHVSSAPSTSNDVATTVGPTSAFVSPGHARELALRPGTTMFRLLTDPADGRLVERTIGSYRPDADMRRQLRWADLRCRYPGSQVPADLCELDHVDPWLPGGAGGPTGETNLATLSVRQHQAKTANDFAVTINERRDMTFTTALGQSVTTRVFDYRGLEGGARAAPDERERPDERDLRPGDPPTYRELLNLALSQSLTSRAPHRCAAEAEDDPDHELYCDDAHRRWWTVPHAEHVHPVRRSPRYGGSHEEPPRTGGWTGPDRPDRPPF